MNCVKDAINQSLDYGTHHIQRLMITGNFALLAGVNPDEIDAWYRIYIDAIEWVQITNTRGMSQFDGGIVEQTVRKFRELHRQDESLLWFLFFIKKRLKQVKTCPFNSLYWNFYDKKEDKLGKKSSDWDDV
jgi:deoxyribodipyrimidine photolyase-related protein